MDKGKLVQFKFKSDDEYKFSKYFETTYGFEILTYQKLVDCINLTKYSEKNNEKVLKNYYDCNNLIKLSEFLKSNDSDDYKLVNYYDYDKKKDKFM